MKDKQKRNNCLKTKMGRKTIVRIFQEKNKQNISREDLARAKKGKP